MACEEGEIFNKITISYKFVFIKTKKAPIKLCFLLYVNHFTYELVIEVQKKMPLYTKILV